MNSSIIECVPNFSEGRHKETIDAIAKSIAQTPGIMVLGIEPDPDYNRTVATFAGPATAVLQAALNATATALERIDMSRHHGEHPRIGAVDVVPFVPLKNASMEECIELARRYGKTVAEQFSIPVFLYENAATAPHRKSLAAIRKGEYEGLKEKLRRAEWQPDFGAPVFNERAGAIVTGAREILIAYNINLATTNVAIAHEIALTIREQGRPVKDHFGNPQKDAEGNILMIPGTLKAVRAIGVRLQQYDITQVSVNLTDYKTTPLHAVYEEVKRLSAFFDVEVLGSEIVGLVPLEALLTAGRYYAHHASLSSEECILVATEKLGLNKLQQFDPKKKIIEFRLGML